MVFFAVYLWILIFLNKIKNVMNHPVTLLVTF